MLPPPLYDSTPIIPDLQLYHNTCHSIFISFLRFVGFQDSNFVQIAEIRRGIPAVQLPDYSQVGQLFLTNESHSVHSGTVGFISCVPTLMLSRLQ